MLTERALLTALHGMCFGAFALLTAFGLVVGILMVASDRSAAARLGSPATLLERVYLGATVLLGWAAVISGTLLVYPWYRATPPQGLKDLHAFPRALLLSSPSTAPWHSLGMEWKEHVAFLAPLAITAVAVVWWKYRELILQDRTLRAALVAFGAAGIGAAGVAGLLGAWLNKLAPTY